MPARVVCRTRSASRCPRRRGLVRWSRTRASRPARTASNPSLLAPWRPQGRFGRSSTVHPLALVDQKPGQPGPIPARPLQGPDPPAWGLDQGQPEQPSIPGLGRLAPGGWPAPHRWLARPGLASPRGGRTVRGHARGRTGFSIRPATMVGQAGPAAQGQISRKAHHRGGQRGLGSLSLPAPNCQHPDQAPQTASQRGLLRARSRRGGTSGRPDLLARWGAARRATAAVAGQSQGREPE